MSDRPRVLGRGASLDEVAEGARAAGRMAFDTEFMREKTYLARLCLVQVAIPSAVVVIDPLEDVDLAPVARLVGDEAVETVVHAGRQDFEIFYERYGVVPSKVFDVQVAAGFVGLGATLPYGRLIEATTGLRLAKSESYTEWCKRPLTQAQTGYAAADVAHLLDAADAIKARLREQGRMAWALDEMAELCDASTYEVDPAEAYKRVSGRGSLSSRQLAVLRELAAWREETARRRDIPRGWVVRDASLVEVARRGAHTPGELRSIRGFPPKEAERSGEPIARAVERGRAAGPLPGPAVPPRTVQVRIRATIGLADALLRVRCEEAGVAPELVATRADLEGLLAAVFTDTSAPPSHPLARGWRHELVGRDLVELARGRVALRPIDRPPYIEEVHLR